MQRNKTDFEVIVVGGGHAGVEAALIAAHLGRSAALITMNLKALGRMSCNPALGGIAKGQMVRELDVLGGIMGFIGDQTGLQFKVLNRSKGRAVWSPRAQVDKRRYEAHVRALLSATANITLIEDEVVDLLDRQQRVAGVVLRDKSVLRSEAVILTTGTFLNGLIHIGKRKIRAGRMGEHSSRGLTEALTSRGLKAGRLKTGTPPRLARETIDWQKLTVVHGDEKPVPFSYRTRNFNPPDIPCHTVRTTAQCHEIIQTNLHQSPLFSGDIDGVGPRYCPSIEDKVHRFAHQPSHTLFLEPEWLNSDQIYTNGFSTSLPESIQLQALRALPGLERVRFYRPGYAIEYDFFPPSQLKATLESKALRGLYFAGQINGTSGYEEAAVQGLVAGINASIQGQAPPFTLGREEAYIGVLIDDLITKDTFEPYRMFTSRAEYRILLRYSNADERLLKKATEYHLLPPQVLAALETKLTCEDQLVRALDQSVLPEEVNPLLRSLNEATVDQKTPARQILKRPAVSIGSLPTRLFNGIDPSPWEPFLRDELYLEVETRIKYAGYIRRQQQQIKRLSAQERVKIPPRFDYHAVTSLSMEARDKLDTIRPENLGQAMRISGVSPADISVLAVLLHR